MSTLRRWLHRIGIRPLSTLRCRRLRPFLAEAALGELDDSRQQLLDRHLERCATCADELAALRATVVTIDEAAHASATPSLDGDRLWARLQPRLDAVDEARRPSFGGGTTLLRPALVAIALAAAFAGGLLLRPEPPTPTAPPAVAAADDSLDARLTRFVDRTTPLVLSLANHPELDRASDDGASDDSALAALETRRAAPLVAAADDLARELDQAGRAREATLVGDLELVLLQLAHLESGRDAAAAREALAMVQATLERRAVLFQLAIHDLSRPRGAEAAPPAASPARRRRV